MFDALVDFGVPVVWNLAGGYQAEPDGTIPRVLEIHDNTMLAAALAGRMTSHTPLVRPRTLSSP